MKHFIILPKYQSQDKLSKIQLKTKKQSLINCIKNLNKLCKSSNLKEIFTTIKRATKIHKQIKLSTP